MDRVSCPVCHRHAATVEASPGHIYDDDLVVVRHAPVPEDAERVYRGWLLVEPKRHLAGLADLTADEAGRMGLLQSVGARALMTVGNIDHVYSFVLGHQVSHLHIHLLPRYEGAPHEYWGVRVSEWPDAPTVDNAALVRLMDRLRAAVDGELRPSFRRLSD